MAVMRKLLTGGEVEIGTQTWGMTWSWRWRDETMEEWCRENENECETEWRCIARKSTV